MRGLVELRRFQCGRSELIQRRRDILSVAQFLQFTLSSNRVPGRCDHVRLVRPEKGTIILRAVEILEVRLRQRGTPFWSLFFNRVLRPLSEPHGSYKNRFWHHPHFTPKSIRRLGSHPFCQAILRCHRLLETTRKNSTHFIRAGSLPRSPHDGRTSPKYCSMCLELAIL